MKKHWLVLIAVTIIAALFSLSACEKNDPVPAGGGDEESATITEKTDNEDESTIDTHVISDPENENTVEIIDYYAGYNYVLLEECKVYDGASDSARLKNRDELSEDAKEHAVPGDAAVLKKETVVTCQEMDGNWMRIPSGWICCRDDNKLYVSDHLTISDDMIKEEGSNSPGTNYDRNGNLISDAFKMIPSDYPLSGKYTIIGRYEGRYDENVSVDFNKDGSCVIKYPEEVYLYTDEEGYWEGCKYTVKDDIVYIRNGGTMGIGAYEIGEGKTLEFLYESTSSKEIRFN